MASFISFFLDPLKNQAPVFLTTPEKKENPFFRQFKKFNRFQKNKLV